MTYINLYMLCLLHNIELIEEFGWLKFYYQGKLCGKVSTQTEHEQQIDYGGAKEGVVANFMRQLTNTTLAKRGAR